MKLDFRGRLSQWYLAVRGYFKSRKMREDVSRKFTAWLDVNKWALLVSVFLATLIYVTVHQKSEISNFDRLAEVVVKGVPPGVSIGVRPSVINVTFRGTKEQWQQASLEDAPKIEIPYPKKQIENPELDKGGNGRLLQVPLKLRYVKWSGWRGFGSLEVVGLESKNVVLAFDREEERMFPIDPPKLTGNPFRGSALVDFNPKAARVRGGQTKLDAWEELGKRLRLPSISVEGRARSFSQEADVLPPEGDEAGIMVVKPQKVTVGVTITQLSKEREFEDVPVRLALSPGLAVLEGNSIDPPVVGVLLKGPEDTVGRIAPSNVAVYAEIGEDALAAGTNSTLLKLSVLVPPDASVFSVVTDPETVLFIPGERPVPEIAESEPAGTNSVVDVAVGSLDLAGAAAPTNMAQVASATTNDVEAAAQ